MNHKNKAHTHDYRDQGSIDQEGDSNIRHIMTDFNQSIYKSHKFRSQYTLNFDPETDATISRRRHSSHNSQKCIIHLNNPSVKEPK